MRKALLFLLFILPVIVLGQTAKDFRAGYRDNKIFYEDVVTVEGVSKEKLYRAVKLTINDLYKNSRRVIKNDDYQEGFISGSGRLVLPEYKWYKEDTELVMNFVVEVKDGKYRIRLNGLVTEVKPAVERKPGAPTDFTDWTEMYERLFIHNVKFLRKSNLNSFKAFDTKVVAFLEKFKQRTIEYAKDDF